MPIQDSDLLVVGRGDASYKITYDDLKTKLEDDGLGGGPSPIDPSPGDGNEEITPPVSGGGTELDPYVLTAKEVEYGGSVISDETITFSNLKEGDTVQFVDQNTGTNGNRFAQPAGVIAADGTWSGQLQFSDLPESSDDTVFDGLLKIGSQSIYYKWVVTVKSPVALAKPEVLTPADGAGVGGDISYFPKTSDILTASVAGGGLVTVNVAKWQTIAYGAGRFVAGSDNNEVMSSTDGINWTYSNLTERIWSVKFLNNQFIAVSSKSLFTSANGISWSAKKNIGGVYDIRDIAWDGSQYIAAGHYSSSYDSLGQKSMAKSTDLSAWSGFTPMNGQSWNTITYGDGKFVAAGSGSQQTQIVYSANGNTWNSVNAGNSSAGNVYRDVIYANNRFVLVGSSSPVNKCISYSDDGISWSDVDTSAIEGGWYGVAYGAGKYVAVSSSNSKQIIYSADGETWTQVTAPESNKWLDIAYGGGMFAAVSENGTHQVMLSADGTEWDGIGITATLTLTNNKVYKVSDSSEITTVDNVFKAGDTVHAESDSGVTGVLAEDASGTSMILSPFTGEWTTGMVVVGDTEATETAPGADDVVFTSSEPATDNGEVTTWGQADWELSVDSGFADKQEASVSLTDTGVQQGPTTFTLEAGTDYWVRTRYNSTDPGSTSEWSEANKFKTATTTRTYEGSNYYDEIAAELVTTDDLVKRYGVDPETTDLRDFGIYPLTEQPDYTVQGYSKQGNSYKPLRDYTAEMEQLAETRAELTAARSRLSSIEADEINDDATDTALLTLIANLTQRVTNLEQS